MSSKQTILASDRKKRTPASASKSKSWKENLRRACIHRVREQQQKRQHRLISPESERPQSRNSNNYNSISYDDDDNSAIMPARLMIEEEMRQQGIGVASPCVVANGDSGQYDGEAIPSVEDYFISEEELFDLLAEVEEEIERTEALRLEEELELARNEQLNLEDQIAEYEQWEEQLREEDGGDNAAMSRAVAAGEVSWSGRHVNVNVLCPICRECTLTETPRGDIVCPNHMDGSCPMQLLAPSRQQRKQHAHQHSSFPPPLTLHELRRRLSFAYEQHSSFCASCPEQLVFDLVTNTNTNMQEETPTRTTLLATCHNCNVRIPVT